MAARTSRIPRLLVASHGIRLCLRDHLLPLIDVLAWPAEQHHARADLPNTPRIAEKHYLLTSGADFDDVAGIESGATDRSGAVDAQQAVSESDPATDRIKQNPAGTYAKSCGVTRVGSDSQGGESGIRTRGQV